MPKYYRADINAMCAKYYRADINAKGVPNFSLNAK
jgi:hypothetical protein